MVDSCLYSFKNSTEIIEDQETIDLQIKELTSNEMHKDFTAFKMILIIPQNFMYNDKNSHIFYKVEKVKLIKNNQFEIPVTCKFKFWLFNVRTLGNSLLTHMQLNYLHSYKEYIIALGRMNPCSVSFMCL